MNSTVMKRVVTAAVVLVLIVAAGVVGYVIAMRSMPATPDSAVATSSNKKILYWFDPMVPQQHFDHPGLSPMGMQMVPKYADESGGAENQNIVRIDPAEVQNLGMRIERVEVGRLSDILHVPGSVAWDQRLVVTVSARTDVTIEKLYVRAPYTEVKAGQPLAEILAPQWSAAAAEYFALRNARSDTGRALRAAARERLHALGMDDATIKSLRAGGGTITLRAPIDGVVSALDVREGQQVGEGMPIMSINGLDSVWVDAAIPQAQSGGVHAGTPIIAKVSALPGETFHGEVEALLPDVDAATRTQRARIVLDNPKHDLAPGMFADLRIAGAAGAPHPLVPDEAIIADGIHTRVIVALGDGQFKPAPVRTGRSSDGMIEILAGLHGGERIVTSGQFLIDSEASLSGALERLGDNPSAASTGELEPLSPRERRRAAPSAKRWGEGSEEPQSSSSSGPSSGPSGHHGALGHGWRLSPEGEGKKHAMPGMTMPRPGSSNGNGVRP